MQLTTLAVTSSVMSLAIACTSAESPGRAAAGPAAPERASRMVPSKLGDKQGIIFAETAGSTVAGKGDGGATVAIPDGAAVEIVAENEAMMGGGEEDASTVILHEGKKLTVPAIRLLVEGALERSPDGRLAVFSTIVSCGDLCHRELYVLAADGRRERLGDGVADVVVAWSKDGKQAAVGSGQLWLVDIATLRVTPLESYTAPAYAPDGTLYIRDQDGSAYILAAGSEPRLVFKAEKDEAEPEEDDYGADDPMPVEFDAAGKPQFDVRVGPGSE
jgi:hypothetical protein